MSAGPLSVAIIGRKGGAGKTTTAINLAGVLAERGQRVLLVDLDPQASMTRVLLGAAAFEVEGIGTRILEPQKGLDGLAQATQIPGVDLYPGDRAIETAGVTLTDNPNGPFRLRKLLRQLGGYDAVILDTPPLLGFALNSAILAAHLAILPTELVQQDLDALTDTLLLREELDELGAARIVAIVPNAVRNDSADRGGLEMLRAQFGDLVASPIPLSVAVKHALNSAVPVTVYDPKSAAALAYRMLADHIASEVSRATP